MILVLMLVIVVVSAVVVGVPVNLFLTGRGWGRGTAALNLITTDIERYWEGDRDRGVDIKNLAEFRGYVSICKLKERKQIKAYRNKRKQNKENTNLLMKSRHKRN